MMRFPFVGRRERLRRQASDWLAKLNGPHGPRDREAFEQWYRAAPDNAETFDRLSAIFGVAEAIRPGPDTAYTRPLAAPPKGPRAGRYAFAAVAAALVVALTLTVRGARDPALPTQREVQMTVFAATGEQARQVPAALSPRV